MRIGTLFRFIEKENFIIVESWKSTEINEELLKIFKDTYPCTN